MKDVLTPAASLVDDTLAPFHAAPQHGPRPLPLFLEIVRSEAAASPDRARAAMRGLRRYQEAERIAPPMPMPVIAEVGHARVHDYGGDGPAVLFVPSIINPARILDLGAEGSLLRWLATQGLRPLLLDWGEAMAGDRELSIAGHVERILVPLIDRLPQPITLAGYCLGGTMAIAAAALRTVRALALIASPWRFSGFPDASRSGLASLWEQAQPLAQQLGLLPIEVLQTAFWQLDPHRTVAKYARFADLDPASAAARDFVALEDWANEGSPLALAAGRELLEDFMAADLPGRGAWQVGGVAIDPAALACPVLDVRSTSDRIVPHASAAAVGTAITLAQGHVGMIVGARAREALWQPLARWLRDPHLG